MPRHGRAFKGVSDGTRTHDRLDHNQELYQLSYAHRGALNLAVLRLAIQYTRRVFSESASAFRGIDRPDHGGLVGDRRAVRPPALRARPSGGPGGPPGGAPT